MRKRTEIDIQIDEVMVVSTSRVGIPQLPCPVCADTRADTGADSVMVTPEEAAAIAGVTVRTIYARVESDSVHFLETPDGLLLLCANSLGQRAGSDALKLVGATNPGADSPPESE